VGLDRLTEAGLLFCRGVAPQSSYLFKHALVQDAAYGTLLRTRRQELHARVAAVLEQHFADLVERQPELLAHHLTAAGQTERAVDQWLKAGRHAAERLAHLEAIRHFDRGLALLALLPECAVRDEYEIELQLARGLSLFTTEAFISPAAAQAYRRACELAEPRADARQLFMAVYGLWQSTTGSGEVARGRTLSDRLLQLTAGAADDGLRLQAHHSAWSTCVFVGELATGREHCAAGSRLYDPERHRSHRFLFGAHDPGVCACVVSGQVDWLLGHPQRGLATSAEGLTLAERIGHPLSLELALMWRSVLHLNRGEPELALQQLAAAEALVTEQRLGFLFEPRFLRGGALIAQGSVAEGIVYLREALGRPLSKNHWRPYGLVLLVEGLSRRGEYAEALALIGEGVKRVEATGERQWEAELHRLRAIALLGQGNVEGSETALKEALRVTRRQQARAYELRAATSLARLWGEQGRRAQARDLLAPVYSWFTEGFDTADLKDAKTLLAELA
jgi:predicted ATPase